ncbi:hypothetical protein K432DRAFT_383360 [Lepidopterella palustris CBS 459.81]|uniref:Uncharacterized protein n=1 Tax=Lepidopterella palustris CBS 459.81 TaxID=1314670 RepID=A0A8E2JDY4_9PEZI|nr:hypothetical protein K432DRAFT_383360 [Lepidopterella palustris CBS 459.81]
MVVIVDLEDEVHDPHADPDAVNAFTTLTQLHHSLTNRIHEPEIVQDERPNPNINGFSAALSCYPIVSELASLLDLNSLHDLSRTCRQFRANLLQYRNQLVNQSLRCVYEDIKPGDKLADRIRESQQAWRSSGSSSTGGRLTSGKVGKCARDMVGECQRCGTVVCRNCIIKPPALSALNGRHRRLCRTCTKAPLSQLNSPSRPRSSSSNAPSPRSSLILPETSPPAFTAPAFQRAPCSCETTIWLCQACGHSLRTADKTYMLGWTWRTKYTRYLGGLGTGIGEGNEGVECGRGAACLAAKMVEHEIDCDAESLAQLHEEAAKVEAEGTGRSWKGTSYFMQEIEGVGGVVKKKVKKRVAVGAVVREHEDEREKGINILTREVSGKVRSWCAWCERVIPGHEDFEVESTRPASSSGSSGFSVVVGQ